MKATINQYIISFQVLRSKQYLRDRMADYVYNGFWFSPEANYVRKCLELSQEQVNGQVTMELRPGYCLAVARQSTTEALYNQELVSMDVHGGYVPRDASGFIAINAVRLREHARAFGPYEVKKQ